LKFGLLTNSENNIGYGTIVEMSEDFLE
jgi:hypothetical protein